MSICTITGAVICDHLVKVLLNSSLYCKGLEFEDNYRIIRTTLDYCCPIELSGMMECSVLYCSIW